MGETIQLKAADGFSFSAYVAGPANRVSRVNRNTAHITVRSQCRPTGR